MGYNSMMIRMIAVVGERGVSQCGESGLLADRFGVFELGANESVVVFHKGNDGVVVHVSDGSGGFGWRIED